VLAACVTTQVPPPATAVGPAGSGVGTRPRPSVALRHGSAAEKATEEQLARLFERYDVTPWLYTKSVVVDEEAVPHSHPTLTLHIRHLRDDLLLLSTFIHEESHWYAEAHQAAVDAAVVELRSLAPGLPVGFPDGAATETSSYEHLGLVRLVGELAAHQVMEFWATDHYRTIYRVVMEKRADVRRIMRAHGLASPLE
jgi:hypothetical protein